MRMNRAFILAIVAAAAALPAKRKEEEPIYYTDEDEDIADTDFVGHRIKDDPVYKHDIVYSTHEDYDTDSGGNVALSKSSNSQVTEKKARTPVKVDRELKYETYEVYESDETYESGETKDRSHVPARSGKHLSQAEKHRRFLGFPTTHVDEEYMDGSYEEADPVRLAPLMIHKQLTQAAEMPSPKPRQAPTVFDLSPSQQAEKDIITPIQVGQLACGQPLFLFAAVLLLATALEVYRRLTAKGAYQILSLGEKRRTAEGIQSEIGYKPLVENTV